MWLTSLLLFSPVYAEVLYERAYTKPTPFVRRQETGSSGSAPDPTPAPGATPSGVLGWYWNSDLWAPTTNYTGSFSYMATTSGYWDLCPYFRSYIYSTATLNASTTLRFTSTSTLTSSGTSACTIWTKCESGIMTAVGGATSFCQRDDRRCMSYTLYESWGGTPLQTSIGCSTSKSNDVLETAFYRISPTVSVTRSASSQTSSGAGPSDTSNPPPAPAKDNTGAIAGGVVGGLAVLAMAGVTIFWIVRRSKNKATDPATPPIDPNATTGYDPYLQNPQAPTGYYQPTYQHDKPELQGDLQQPIYEAPPNERGYVSPVAGSLSPDPSAYGANEYRSQSTSPQQVPGTPVQYQTPELPTSPGLNNRPNPIP